MARGSLFKKFFADKPDPVQKESELSTVKNLMRPTDNDYLFALNRSQVWGFNDTVIGMNELYQMRVYSDVLQNILNTLRNEIFRRGIGYRNITTYDNVFQEEKIKRFLRAANLNKQTLKEVFQELEDDMNIVDDMYIMARKNYLVNGNNEIIGGEVIEFLRIHPASVEMLFDDTSRLGHDKDGKPIYFDVEDRTQTTNRLVNKNGLKNLRACYKVKSAKDGSYQYYDTSEILHVSKYHPSKTYGFSVLYSLNNKVMTLMNMDYYIRQYYSGNKVPKGILTVNTTNATGFRAFWDEFMEKVRLNPHSVNPLIHQSSDGKDPIKWIDFMRNLQEMQYTEVRNEMVTKIGAVFNVSPIFQNDTSTGGGLNNEGLQITVTDRGVEVGQAIYNEKVLPWIQEQLGITDFELFLEPSKEIDEVYEKELRLKEIAIARATAELGITVSMNETGEFSYKPGRVTIQSSQPSIYPPAVMETDTSPLSQKAGNTSFVKKKNNFQEVLDPKQEKEIESALLNELKKLLKQFETKTRPTKEELDRKIAETVKNFDSVVKTKSSAKLKAIYIKAAQDLGREIGQKFTLAEQDKNIIEALKREPVYQEAFRNISVSLSDKLKQAVVDAYSTPEGFKIDTIVANMKENTDAIESDLRRIARTETTKISTAARKVQYDKTGKAYKYYHIGPDDNRTTLASKEVKTLTKNGVSWDEYVDIIQKVAGKYNPKWIVNRAAPITHPNTRHVFIARLAEA